MAQDLTAAALLDVQAQLESIFTAEATTPSRYPWVNHLGTANGMLQNHMANIDPIRNSNGDCIGFNVYHLEKGTATLDYDGDGTNNGLACDVLSGEGATAVETTYDFNILKVKNVEVDDNVCGNFFKDPVMGVNNEQVATLIANRLNSAMWAIRSSLNTTCINFFDANKTAVNNDSSLPTGVAFSGGTFTVTESTLPMNDPDTLTDLEAIALNNDMVNYFFMSGRYHFYNARRNSQYHQLNDNERDVIRWGDTAIFFDIKNLDATLSGKNTFAVDPGAYLFYNHVDENLSQVPFLASPADNLYEFIIDDPIMVVRENGVFRPLRYQVAYQKVCNNVNATTLRRTYTHRWEVKLHAGLHAAPPSEDGHTGILKFKSA